MLLICYPICILHINQHHCIDTMSVYLMGSVQTFVVRPILLAWHCESKCYDCCSFHCFTIPISTFLFLLIENCNARKRSILNSNLFCFGRVWISFQTDFANIFSIYNLWHIRLWTGLNHTQLQSYFPFHFVYWNNDTLTVRKSFTWQIPHIWILMSIQKQLWVIFSSEKNLTRLPSRKNEDIVLTLKRYQYKKWKDQVIEE